jgi:transcriptional regulator with XRE-family HTH domain
MATYQHKEQGLRLSKLRGYLELSQSEMANSLGLSQSGWAALETGRNKIGDSLLLLLEMKFGVVPDYVHGKTDLMIRIREPSSLSAVSDRIADYMNTNGITLMQASQDTKVPVHAIANMINTRVVDDNMRDAFMKTYNIDLLSDIAPKERLVYEHEIERLKDDLERYTTIIDQITGRKKTAPDNRDGHLQKHNPHGNLRETK